jgi:hypothetical protein
MYRTVCNEPHRRVALRANCPCGEISSGRHCPWVCRPRGDCPWGNLSMGPIVHSRIIMGWIVMCKIVTGQAITLRTFTGQDVMGEDIIGRVVLERVVRRSIKQASLRVFCLLFGALCIFYCIQMCPLPDDVRYMYICMYVHRFRRRLGESTRFVVVIHCEVMYVPLMLKWSDPSGTEKFFLRCTTQPCGFSSYKCLVQKVSALKFEVLQWTVLYQGGFINLSRRRSWNYQNLGTKLEDNLYILHWDFFNGSFLMNGLYLSPFHGIRKLFCFASYSRRHSRFYPLLFTAE